MQENVLKVTEENPLLHPQACLLGAPLDAGSGLYLNLQNKYC